MGKRRNSQPLATSHGARSKGGFVSKTTNRCHKGRILTFRPLPMNMSKLVVPSINMLVSPWDTKPGRKIHGNLMPRKVAQEKVVAQADPVVEEEEEVGAQEEMVGQEVANHHLKATTGHGAHSTRGITIRKMERPHGTNRDGKAARAGSQKAAVAPRYVVRSTSFCKSYLTGRPALGSIFFLACGIT